LAEVVNRIGMETRKSYKRVSIKGFGWGGSGKNRLNNKTRWW